MALNQNFSFAVNQRLLHVLQFGHFFKTSLHLVLYVYPNIARFVLGGQVHCPNMSEFHTKKAQRKSVHPQVLNTQTQTC